MQIKIEVKDGVLKVTDATTGANLDWAEEITITRDPSGKPFIFLGTHTFTIEAVVGAVPVPVPTPPPVGTGGPDVGYSKRR